MHCNLYNDITSSGDHLKINYQLYAAGFLFIVTLSEILSVINASPQDQKHMFDKIVDRTLVEEGVF